MKIYEVKKSRKDYPKFNISRGDQYFYCRPKRSHSKKIMKPTREELLIWINDYARGFMGEFSSNMESWRGEIENISDSDSRDSLLDEVSNFLDQKQDSLSNIPDQLQEGHMINDQINELEELILEIEDLEIDE